MLEAFLDNAPESDFSAHEAGPADHGHSDCAEHGHCRHLPQGTIRFGEWEKWPGGYAYEKLGGTYTGDHATY
jgi:hypothetical protein